MDVPLFVLLTFSNVTVRRFEISCSSSVVVRGIPDSGGGGGGAPTVGDLVT